MCLHHNPAWASRPLSEVETRQGCGLDIAYLEQDIPARQRLNRVVGTMPETIAL